MMLLSSRIIQHKELSYEERNEEIMTAACGSRNVFSFLNKKLK